MEDVTCVLTNEMPVCKTIKSENDSKAIEVTVKLDSTNFRPNVTINPVLKATLSQDSSLWKDIISIIITLVALSGVGFNIYNIKQLKRNRLNDFEKEKFIFWLKEILFPEYISPTLQSLKKLNVQYEKIIKNPENYNDTEKSTFQEQWSKEKIDLINIFIHAASLPYLSDLFIDLHKKINELDDSLVRLFFPLELVEIPTTEAPPDLLEINVVQNNQALIGSELTMLISEVYNRINVEQAKHS